MVRGKVKVAAVQSAPESYNLEDTLEYAQGLAGEAKDAGARLVVFPEAFICGYPRHTGFNIGSRSDEDRKWYSLYVEVCLAQDTRKRKLNIYSNTIELGEDPTGCI